MGKAAKLLAWAAGIMVALLALGKAAGDVPVNAPPAAPERGEVVHIGGRAYRVGTTQVIVDAR